MTKSKPLIIYHASCADGFGACMAAYKRFGDNADYYTGFYNETPPDCANRKVYLLDFSYKKDVVLEMLKVAEDVTILDHHKSAIEDLADLFMKQLPELSQGKYLHGVLDASRSGAMIAWNYFFPKLDFSDVDKITPELIKYIQDRDLWKFELEGSKEIALAIFSYPYDFDTWEGLFEMPIEDLINEGRALLRKHNKDIEEYLKVGVRKINIGAHKVPVVNVPYFYGSDACNILCQNEPFAAYYWDGATHRNWGLRSAPDGLDVAEIAAKNFNGGGHKHAAGFRTDLNWCGDV